MKKENKHRKRIPQPFAGGNPFSHSFFLKTGEEEVEVKLCYPVISRQIQGRRYRKNELNSSEEGGQLYDERYFLCVAEAIA